jgi:hypothetical protein
MVQVHHETREGKVGGNVLAEFDLKDVMEKTVVSQSRERVRKRRLAEENIPFEHMVLVQAGEEAEERESQAGPQEHVNVKEKEGR